MPAATPAPQGASTRGVAASPIQVGDGDDLAAAIWISQSIPDDILDFIEEAQLHQRLDLLVADAGSVRANPDGHPCFASEAHNLKQLIWLVREPMNE